MEWTLFVQIVLLITLVWAYTTSLVSSFYKARFLDRLALATDKESSFYSSERG